MEGPDPVGSESHRRLVSRNVTQTSLFNVAGSVKTGPRETEMLVRQFLLSRLKKNDEYRQDLRNTKAWSSRRGAVVNKSD